MHSSMWSVTENGHVKAEEREADVADKKVGSDGSGLRCCLSF